MLQQIIRWVHQKFQEYKEDREDWQLVVKARKSREEHGTVSWEEIKREYAEEAAEDSTLD